VTAAARARHLDHWAESRSKFVKVFPNEYKRALGELQAAKEAGDTIAKAKAADKKTRRSLPSNRERAIRSWEKSPASWNTSASKRATRPSRPRQALQEFIVGLKADEAKIQGARCMDCGIPFCNNGCPVNNIIPDFNDLVYRDEWRNAFAFSIRPTTSPSSPRICPAPCEEACTLNVNDDRWASRASSTRSSTGPGKKAGSCRGRPSRAAARRSPWSAPARPVWRRRNSRARRPHRHAVRKNDRIGGLLRYGIPDFKMEKSHIDDGSSRSCEGVVFRTGVLVGTCPKAASHHHAAEIVTPCN